MATVPDSLRGWFFLTQECFARFPVTVSRRHAISPKPRESDQEVLLDFSQLDKLQWKNHPCKLSDFRILWEGIKEIRISQEIIIIPSSTGLRTWVRLYQSFLNLINLLAKENIFNLDIWGKTHRITPTGFVESQAGSDQSCLEELYKDNWIVKEKKSLLIDLESSCGSYIISAGKEKHSIIDGAAQIASLTTGFNHISTLPMLVRPELFDPHLELKNWDVLKAYGLLLKSESGLPNVEFGNSGSEAIEIAFRECQRKYPKRRKIIAFEGSFHGRTLLSLHATHSPSKRLPFETFSQCVTFLPFPETKTPALPAAEPSHWMKHWSGAETSKFLDGILPWLCSGDKLLEQECLTLLKLKVSIENEKPLAVIVEPMQCEGGERYATARFFRALRVLTRAMGVLLIFDEVQTGFGLGGKFFWSQLFQLKDKDGNPDYPDAICLAKKAQIGVCLHGMEARVEKLDQCESNDRTSISRLESSAASIYRGYLQALQIKETDFSGLTTKVSIYLKSLQECLGSFYFQNPRNLGLAFAFDLPGPQLLNKLVEARFPNGIIFYPAGDITARFRLTVASTDREIAQIFLSIFRCFQTLSEKGHIGKIHTIEDWLKKLPPLYFENVRDCLKSPSGVMRSLSWEENNPSAAGLLKSPVDKNTYLGFSCDQWQEIFNLLVKNIPQLLSNSLPLDSLLSMTIQDLWHRYENDLQFSLLDLLWETSRLKGAYIERVREVHQIEQVTKDIRILEELLYEPARRDDPELFMKLARDDRSILFLARDHDGGNLIGFSMVGPLSYFKTLPMVDRDPANSDPNALYSADVSVHPDHQKKGLGLRLKCEQIIAAFHEKISYIRSRNRVPEAGAMIKLNRALGAVILDENASDYGGGGSAIYQSLTISQRSKSSLDKFFKSVKHPFEGALRNKTSLANFVSQNYISNLLFIQNLVPSNLRHIYLSSSRAEAMDKIIKLVRFKNKKAKVALSFRGDFFGETTAVSRSLGGSGELSYFQWPLLSWTSSMEEIKRELSAYSPEETLGLYVDVMDRSRGQLKSWEFLKNLRQTCRALGFPLFLHDGYFTAYLKCRHQYEEVDPDGLIFYMGGQLGMICVSKDFFLEEPLMMISTWDGDEHSLNLARIRAMATLLELEENEAKGIFAEPALVVKI